MEDKAFPPSPTNIEGSRERDRLDNNKQIEKEAGKKEGKSCRRGKNYVVTKKLLFVLFSKTFTYFDSFYFTSVVK